MESKEKLPEEITKLAEYLIKNYTTDSFRAGSKISKMKYLSLLVIEGNLTIENIDEASDKLKIDDKLRHQAYNDLANEILAVLEEKLIRTRARAQTAYIRSIKPQEKKEKKKTGYVSKKKKKEQAGVEEIKPGEMKVESKDMSSKEMIKQIEADEKFKEDLEKKREEEVKTAEEERKKFSKAYRFAFKLFSRVIDLKNKNDNEAQKKLSEYIVALGDPVLSQRQQAAERLLKYKNLNIAVDSLIASLKDKNIIFQIVQAISKTSDFRSVRYLLNSINEFPGDKGAYIRGEIYQTIGRIIFNMNRKTKNSGTLKFYSFVKEPQFESKLKILLPTLKKDLQNK